MKKINFVSFIIYGLFICWACSGSESTSPKTSKPKAPVLIHHLGDAGDDSLTTFYSQRTQIKDSNNGIDAFPDSDAMQLRWMPIVDSNIDYIEIYRYNLIGSEGEESEHKLITTITYDNPVEEYLDDFSDLVGLSSVGINWFYYLKIFNIDGLSNKSNVVSYELMQKPLPLFPQNNQIVANDEELTFSWANVGQNHCRVLLFDKDYKLIWSYDWFLTETAEPVVKYSDFGGPAIWDDEFYWRVDAMSSSQQSGSESVNVRFYLGQ